MKFRAAPVLAVMGGLVLAAAVIAQIEGGDRGIAPLDSSSDFEVTGIGVDVHAKTAEAARLGGWRIAQRKGWQMLWARTHGGDQAGAPALGDSALDGIVAGIVVEKEQIGAQRYVAHLGVLFDRARAGSVLGVTGQVAHSAPMLVIPVMWSGGGPTSFEVRNEWQKAWARFRAGSSPIDYVRPSGTGSDPLLLNYGQTQRPGRRWWRMLLDQYGAADVLVPQVRIERAFPGGPVSAYFAARHGPASDIISTFVLHVDRSDKLPAMLDEGVQRIDRIYADAMAMGVLAPDPSLIETPTIDTSALIADAADAGNSSAAADNATQTPADGTAPLTKISVQYETPDVGSVSVTEIAVRAIAGVTSATTNSLALGGTSVMTVTFQGDSAALKTALEARGYHVDEGGGTLRIRRQ